MKQLAQRASGRAWHSPPPRRWPAQPGRLAPSPWGAGTHPTATSLTPPGLGEEARRLGSLAIPTPGSPAHLRGTPSAPPGTAARSGTESPALALADPSFSRETQSPCLIRAPSEPHLSPIQARHWALSSLLCDLGVSLPLSPGFAGVCLLTEAVIISSINLWRGFY